MRNQFRLTMLLALCSLASCSSYLQFVTLSSETVKYSGESFVYEGKDIDLFYSFYELDGALTFVLVNKTDKPLYIDWKKSSFILRGEKIDYWKDETVSKGSTAFAGYELNQARRDFSWASASIGAAVSSTVAQRPERITFLPPRSAITIAKFKLLRSDQHFLLKDAHCLTLQGKLYGKTKDIDACVVEYSIDDSPFVFRNYLTYSKDENFAQEEVIDNSFAATRIVDVNRKHLKFELFNGNEAIGNPQHNTFYLDLIYGK